MLTIIRKDEGGMRTDSRLFVPFMLDGLTLVQCEEDHPDCMGFVDINFFKKEPALRSVPTKAEEESTAEVDEEVSDGE